MKSCQGYLRYFNNPHKLIVEIDDSFGDYYRSLIPKSLRVNKQKYNTHISIVRKEKPNLEFWNKYQDKLVNFEYEPVLYNDETYFWLNAYSIEFEHIRTELGLTSTSEITKSPDGRHKFHITIGNIKNI